VSWAATQEGGHRPRYATKVVLVVLNVLHPVVTAAWRSCREGREVAGVGARSRRLVARKRAGAACPVRGSQDGAAPVAEGRRRRQARRAWGSLEARKGPVEKGCRMRPEW